MRHRLVLVGACVLVFALVGVAAAQQGSSEPVNGSFEGTYVEWSPRINLAPNWRLVYWKGEPKLDGGARGASGEPECKPILAAQFPYRVRSGDKAQCCFWFYWHGDAALYQVVPQVEAGQIQVKAWAHTWSGNSDSNPFEAGEMYFSIGIDPAGRDPQQGGWPWETSVIWSPFQRATSAYQQFKSEPVTVTRDGPVTVYVRFYSKWDEKHGDAYIDDVELVRLGGGAQTPAPTYTPYPTYTPQPTVTPCPTCPTGGGEGCDYGVIRSIVATVVAEWDRR